MTNFALRPMRLALALSLLSGCGTVSSSAGSDCPPLRDYDRAFLNQLAEEIDKAPIDAAFPIAMQDYATLREQIRACR